MTEERLLRERENGFVPMYIQVRRDLELDACKLRAGEVYNVASSFEHYPHLGGWSVMVYAIMGDLSVEVEVDEYDVILWRLEPRRTS
jgi:hypothetical protein